MPPTTSKKAPPTSAAPSATASSPPATSPAPPTMALAASAAPPTIDPAACAAPSTKNPARSAAPSTTEPAAPAISKLGPISGSSNTTSRKEFPVCVVGWVPLPVDETVRFHKLASSVLSNQTPLQCEQTSRLTSSFSTRRSCRAHTGQDMTFFSPQVEHFFRRFPGPRSGPWSPGMNGISSDRPTYSVR